jgi:hypothetical protein
LKLGAGKKEKIEPEDVEGGKYNLIISTIYGNVYMIGNDTYSTRGTAEVEIKQNNNTLVSGSKIWLA